MRSNLSSLCRSCGKCCQSLVLPMRKSSILNKAQIGDWLSKRGVQIVEEDGDSIYLNIPFACPHLFKSDDNLFGCDIYGTDQYPVGCGKFDGSKYSFLKCKWKSIPKNYILEKAGRFK